MSWTRGYKSGFPEATTPELDEYFCHFHGGSPSPVPPHFLNCPETGTCEFGPFMNVTEAVAALGTSPPPEAEAAL
jgi:hypothetical protein